MCRTSLHLQFFETQNHLPGNIFFMPIHIGDNINALRKRSNLSLRALGEGIAKTNTTIQKYESGKVTPSIEVIYQIADFFKVPAGAIMTEDLTDEEVLRQVVSGQWGRVVDKDEQKRIEREKALLHQALDAKENKMERLSQAFAELKAEMAAIPPESALYGKIQRLLSILNNE